MTELSERDCPCLPGAPKHVHNRGGYAPVDSRPPVDLVGFLRARIGEDKARALSAGEPEESDVYNDRGQPGEHWQWVTVFTDRPVPVGDLAEALSQQPISLRSVEQYQTSSGVGVLPTFLIDEVEEGKVGALAHVVHWQPARVLAECQVKLRIVDLHGGQPYDPSPDLGLMDMACSVGNSLVRPDECPTLRLMGLLYVEHVDYRGEWKP